MMIRTRTTQYYLAGMIALLTVAVYLPALQNGFLNWDDNVYVVENPSIRSVNLFLFKWAFLHFHAGNWHPLTWLSHALDYAVWGLNPLGHHLTSILLHGVNTFLVVLLIIRLFEGAKRRAVGPGLSDALPERMVLIAGCVTGLLFGLHPLHVESVAWVAERKDLLCALFFLLTIIWYVRYETAADGDRTGTSFFRRSFNKNLLPCLGFFGLALLSKPMAVSLPAVLLILDWYPLNKIHSLRSFRGALIEKLPFAALSLLSSIMTVLAQKSGGAIVSTEGIPLLTRIPVSVQSLLSYLWKMILPLNLLPYYSYPKSATLFSFPSLAAVLLVTGITAACVVLAIKEKRAWLSIWSYYVITLLPVIGIVQVGSQSMADRYTYLPSLGPFLMAGLLSAWVLNKVLASRKSALIMNLASAGVVLAVFVLSSLTFKQITHWKNSLSLWNFEIKHEASPDSLVYLQRGLVFENIGQLDNALKDYDTSISLNPSFYQAYNNRGLVHEQMGMLENAVHDYDMAIFLHPSFYQAYNNRGLAYERMGKFEKALNDYNTAIALNSSNYESYDNAAVLYANAGMVDKALDCLNRAIMINQNYVTAYNSRGLLYYALDQYESSLDDFNKTLELNPYFGDAYLNRGNLFLKSGNRESALTDFQKACSLGNAEACILFHQLTKG